MTQYLCYSVDTRKDKMDNSHTQAPLQELA